MKVDKNLLGALGLSLLLTSCERQKQVDSSGAHPETSQSTKEEAISDLETYHFKIHTRPSEEQYIDSVSRGRVLGYAARILEIPTHNLQQIVKVIPEDTEGVYNVIVDVNDEILARKIGRVINDSFEKFALQAEEDHRAINLHQ